MTGWLRRRSLPVLVCALACAVLALLIAIALPDKYSAQAVVVVPPGGTSGLTPGEASNLATTYANLIPEDRAILQRAATVLGLDPVTVGDNLLVTHDFDTSILRLSYSDTDPELAIRGSRTIAQSIEGPDPVSPRIAPRSISVVALPNEATTDSLEPLQAAVFGFILGLVGGSLIMIAWERADARIRDVRTLGAEVGCPASSLTNASEESIVALLDRWGDIGGAVPLRVALLAATTSAEDDCVRAAHQLVLAGPQAERRVARIGEPGAQLDPHVLLDVGGAVGGLAAGERLVRTADLIVLVVVADTPVEDLRHALEILDQFGSRPEWALFVAQKARSESRRPVQAPPVVMSPPPSIAPASPARAPASAPRSDRWNPVSQVPRVDAPPRRAGSE